MFTGCIARLNRLMSFAKQEPPQVRVPSWSADSGSPEQSREPTAAASTHEESAYRHASHPFLVTTHQSYVDRIMEAIEGVPQSRRIPSSEDRGEGVPAEAGTTSLFLAIPRIRTRINPIQSFPHTTEDTTGQFFLPVEHVGFSSDTSCRPPPAAKADRTIERNVANTYHKYSLPSKNGASASMHDGPHRARERLVPSSYSFALTLDRERLGPSARRWYGAIFSPRTRWSPVVSRFTCRP